MATEYEAMIWWIRICLIVAAVSTTAFPVLYALSPWHRAWLGRALMFQSLTFALVVDMTAIFTFWRPNSPSVMIGINLAIFTLIAMATSSLTAVLWQKNYNIRTRKVQEWTTRMRSLSSSVRSRLTRS